MICDLKCLFSERDVEFNVSPARVICATHKCKQLRGKCITKIPQDKYR